MLTSILRICKLHFESFHWLSHHGLWAIISCSTNMVSVRMIFGSFCFCFTLAFCIFRGRFKQSSGEFTKLRKRCRGQRRLNKKLIYILPTNLAILLSYLLSFTVKTIAKINPEQA